MFARVPLHACSACCTRKDRCSRCWALDIHVNPCPIPCYMPGGRPTNVGLGSCEMLNHRVHAQPWCHQDIVRFSKLGIGVMAGLFAACLSFQIEVRLGSPSPSLEALWYLMCCSSALPPHHRSVPPFHGSGTEPWLRRSSTAGVASSTFRPEG